ncbi:MAG: DUF2300 domain-containing protein [Azoarcus sp.]|jgi:uncharacterized protein YfaQ (DUF2300 family)|nr:DUF2300 domain-containing protein [Azoarcus sp.]
MFRPGAAVSPWRLLLPLIAACGCPCTAAAQAAGELPALEILWDSGTPGEPEWRSFDASGKPQNINITRLRKPGENQRTGPNAHTPASTDKASAPGPQDPFAARAPLGSLWKLFVYTWLLEERHPAPDYVCTGAQGASAAAREHRAEEIYCCNPGQAIERDAALLRSCGLFFSPERLAIKPQAWRQFWQARPGVRANAPWLAELSAMKPETVVPPASILDALAAVPANSRETAANVLLARLFDSGAAPAPTELARGLGSQLRIKTFSWHRPGKPGTRYGGAAGWLSDGRPIWFAGEGTGQQIMARHGATLAAALSETLSPENTAPAPGCIKVNFFARYPFTLEQAGGKPAAEGILRGRYVARFPKGVSVPITANGELSLTRESGRDRIEGRFGLDDYVARVIEREADATQTEAARALSVVIRSYLLNEAKKQGNCLAIDDSSHAQRVSPNPPGAAARAAAGFSAGLILRGAPVGYHSHTPSKNRMAWTEAAAASRAGEPWDLILRKAFPDADLAAMHDPAGLACRQFTQAETWLAARAQQWRRSLQERLRGFEPPPSTPRVCLLPHGAPFSEQDRNRIHVRGLKTMEDRLALTHEYLHLGLRHHPSGHDEELIEHWARRLILGESAATD